MSDLVHSQSEDLWSKAVASLTPELRALFSVENPDRRGALEVLLYQARRQREVCIKRQWRITKKSGDIIILRDVFEKIIQCVDKFKMLGNAAAEFAPGYASVPWAVIKMLLQTGINDTTAFAGMIDGVEEVTSIIARCAVFEAVYMRHTTSATDHLEASLVSLYAEILSFLGISCQYFSTNTGKRFMKATLDPAKEIEDALKRVDLKQKEVERTTQIASMEIMYDTSARMHDLTAMVSNLVAKLETTNASIANLNIISTEKADSMRVAIASIMGPTKRTTEKRSITLNDHLRVEEREQVYEWLSPLRYASHHLTEAKDRLSNSGEWLFQSSVVIDLHLTQAAEQGPMAAPIAYFYCARNSAEAGRSDPDQVLSCIARQLCGDNTEEIVNEDLLYEWEHVGKPPIGQKQLKIESIMGLIMKTLAGNPATIIIDALDELRADRRHEIFEYLDQIVKQSPNVVKVLLTSRNDGDIVCRLDTTPNIYISAQENQADIERFIEAELDKAIAQKRLLRGDVSTDVRLRITLTLNHGAQGRFRWVSLQIQNLCDPQRMQLEEDVLHELRQLPESLFDLYKIAFDQIRRLGLSSYEVALSALQLLLVAARPITWPEFLHILQLSHSEIQPPLSREQLLNITCDFVKDDGQQECPRFAHQSAREYLEAHLDFANGVAETKAAQMCLLHIGGPENSDTTGFRYSSFYVGNHLSATVPEQRVALHPHLQELLLPSTSEGVEWGQSDLFRKWRRRINTPSTIRWALDKTDSADNCVRSIVSISPLAAICAMGLDEIIFMLKPSAYDIFSHILQMPSSKDVYWADPDTKAAYCGRTCFMLAIILDQPRIVTAVRNLGFPVDTPSKTGVTALSLAAELGNPNLIRELLVCGANPNQICQPPDEQDILDLGPEKCPEPSLRNNKCRAVTSMGFHVNRSGRHEIQSPFHYKGEKRPIIHDAMNNKHGAECVSILIEFGADVNTRTSSNVTALQNCLEYGNLEIMFEVFKILLEAGADVSALLGSGRRIAHVVAAMGHCELIRQLLDAGADCSSRDVFHQSPLELAIRYGHAETAGLLESVYGPPLPRRISSDSLNEQIIPSPPPGLSVPSIYVQDYGSGRQSLVCIQPNYAHTETEPGQLQFTPFESFEWDQVVNAKTSKRLRYQRSIRKLFRKVTSSS